MQGGPGRRWAPARPGLGVQICCREDAPGPSEPAEGRTPTSAGPGALHPQGPAAGVRSLLSTKPEIGWSRLKRKWPQHLTKGASFFLRGSQYLTREGRK